MTEELEQAKVRFWKVLTVPLVIAIAVGIVLTAIVVQNYRAAHPHYNKVAYCEGGGVPQGGVTMPDLDEASCLEHGGTWVTP
jgi:hypothetical protein